MYQEASRLYQIGFPYHEQREEHSQVAIMDNTDYHFYLIYDKSVFVGLVLYWKQKQFIYIEHLCILPEMRNKQYGQKNTLSFAEER